LGSVGRGSNPGISDEHEALAGEDGALIPADKMEGGREGGRRRRHTRRWSERAIFYI